MLRRKYFFKPYLNIERKESRRRAFSESIPLDLVNFHLILRRRKESKRKCLIFLKSYFTYIQRHILRLLWTALELWKKMPLPILALMKLIQFIASSFSRINEIDTIQSNSWTYFSNFTNPALPHQWSFRRKKSKGSAVVDVNKAWGRGGGRGRWYHNSWSLQVVVAPTRTSKLRPRQRPPD